jgi:hypothetical protein
MCCRANGTEDTTISIVHGATWNKIRAIAAMKGYIAEQRAVLAFQKTSNRTSRHPCYVLSNSGPNLGAMLGQGRLAFSNAYITRSTPSLLVCLADWAAVQAAVVAPLCASYVRNEREIHDLRIRQSLDGRPEAREPRPALAGRHT